MTANSFIHLKNFQWKTALENSVYIGLASVLIGHVFFINGEVNYINAALVMIGIVFGTLAIYRLTPLNNWLSGKDVATPADILYFTREQPTDTHRPDDGTHKHAA